MKGTPPPFNSDTSFIDLMMVNVMGFIVLLALAMTMINPPKKENSEKSPIEIPSDVLITLEWEDDSRSDLDLFVQLPNEQVVFYNNRDIPGSNLDRDDLGVVSDTIILPDGSKQVIKGNWEHVFITKLMPGWHKVNVLLFSNNDHKPVKYKVRIQKFQPYKLIYSGSGIMKSTRDEDTVLNFKIGKDGSVLKQSSAFRSLVADVMEVYDD